MSEPQKATALIPIFVTVPEAAQLLSLKPDLLYRYIWDKKGPKVVRFGRLVRIRTEDLLRWADKETHPTRKPKKD